MHVKDLTRVLKLRSKHVQIEKKVRSLGRKTTTLPKPLEKPQMERIRRGIGFQKTKHLLDRWDAVVTSQRAASHVSFPLSYDASEGKEAVRACAVQHSKEQPCTDLLIYKRSRLMVLTLSV